MPYQITWLLENRIMLITYEGVVTSAEFKNYVNESLDMSNQAITLLGENGSLLHTITDARRLIKMEINLKDAQKVLHTLGQRRIGWSIYVATNRLDIFFASLGYQFAKVRHRSFPTVNEAIEFLKSTDDTLKNFTYMEMDETLDRPL